MKQFGKYTIAAFALAGTACLSTFAAEYRLESDGNPNTLNDAIGKATKDDVIYLAPGNYVTTTQWGPQLKAKIVGLGATRDEVVIRSAGEYRTLRTAVGSWIENVTIVGNSNSSKVDKGGAIEMSGGTVTNCVIRDGAAYGNGNKHCGGNLYINAAEALVVDCLITGGKALCHGGNVMIDSAGTVRNCTIADGVTLGAGAAKPEDDQPHGANVYMYQGTVENCTITNGTSLCYAGNVYMDGSAALLKDCTIGEGSGTEGGSIYMVAGTVMNCTVRANGTTRGSGGGIYMNGTGCLVEDSLVDGTDGVMSWHGGCIYMKNGTVRDTTCQNGVCTNSTNREGGNLFMENGKLEKVTLLNGTCVEKGGNLYMKGGAVEGLICRGGTAGSDGGNVRAENGTIIDAVIEDGTIKSDGQSKGANIYLDGSTKLIRAKVTGGTIVKKDGTPGYEGGSICMYSGSALIDNCLVTGSNCGGILSGTTGHVYGTTCVNNAYGYWSWNESQTLQNCVLFGNTKEYTGNQPSGSNGRCINCAVSANSLSTTTYPTLKIVTDADFVDFAGGDYRPAAESLALVDTGVQDTRTDAPTLDLDGNPRLRDEIDIGCYEYQHSHLTVTFSIPVIEPTFYPATATFTATAVGVPEDASLSYEVNFGDGEVTEFTTDQITHVYEDCGEFTISVVAKAGAEKSKAMTRNIRIADRVIRVGGESSYKTIAEGVAAALAGCEVRIASGTYEIESPIVIDKAITVSGEGTVIVRNIFTATESSVDHRVMKVSGGATLVNLILENGQVYNGLGGCLSLDGSTVSNCVIRGGIAKGTSDQIGGSGVVVLGTSLVTHCEVTGNTIEGTPKNDFGGALMLASGSKSTKVLNTLIANNTLVCTEGKDPTKTTAGVMFGGNNENSIMENCTVAGNRVVGALASNSAGLYCGSWSANFRNNVIAGNFETAKEDGKYTSAYIVTDHCQVLNVITDDAESLTKDENNFVAKREEMFKDFAGGNYRPRTGGALIDRGMKTSIVEGTDLLGKPRVKFDGIDIGCYESQYRLGLTITLR